MLQRLPAHDVRRLGVLGTPDPAVHLSAGGDAAAQVRQPGTALLTGGPPAIAREAPVTDSTPELLPFGWDKPAPPRRCCRVETASGWKVAWHPMGPAPPTPEPGKASSGLLHSLSRGLSILSQGSVGSVGAGGQRGQPSRHSVPPAQGRLDVRTRAPLPPSRLGPAHSAAGSTQATPTAAAGTPNGAGGGSPACGAAADVQIDCLLPVPEEAGRQLERQHAQHSVSGIGRIQLDHRRRLVLQQSALLTSVVLPERGNSLRGYASLLLDARGNASPLPAIAGRAHSLHLGSALGGGAGTGGTGDAAGTASAHGTGREHRYL